MKKIVIIIITFCFLFSSLAFAQAEDYQKDTMDHIGFIDYIGSNALSNNISIDFTSVSLYQIRSSNRDPKFYYAKGRFLFDTFPVEISVRGVEITITNKSDKLQIIKWNESVFDLGYYSGIPFLSDMAYANAGNPQQTPDTIIPPGKTISKELYIAKTYYSDVDEHWEVAGTLIPRDNSLSANLYIKVADEDGNSKYYTVKSPHIGFIDNRTNSTK